MPGIASLLAAGVEAEFADGRLCRLIFADAEPALTEPVRSYVTTAAGAMAFEPVSAFAFDGGLREVMALPGGGMTLAVDYLVAAAGVLAVQVSVSCETSRRSCAGWCRWRCRCPQTCRPAGRLRQRRAGHAAPTTPPRSRRASRPPAPPSR